MIKLVLSDMDGTLVPFGNKAISTRTAAAIHKLLDAGIAFGPASGRLIFDIKSYLRYDTELYQTGVFANGKMVRYQGETIYSHPMDRDAMNRLIDALRTTTDCIAYICTPDEQDNSVFSAVGTTREKIERVIGGTLHATGLELIDELPDGPIYALGVMAAPTFGTAEQAVKKLQAMVPDFDYASPAPHSFDVLPKGVSKVNGTHVLLDRMGLSLDEVVFFGDADNDMTMLEYLTQTFVVSNGSEAARRRARWHIGSANDDAPARLIEELAAAGGKLPEIFR